MNRGDKHVVAGELVLRPAALLGAAFSCLRNTGLYMAARLGTTCKDVMNDHSMWNMALVCTSACSVLSDTCLLIVCLHVCPCVHLSVCLPVI